MANFIFDVDGTLRNFETEPNINPNLYFYLSQAKQKNKLYIVTGRTYNNFLNFLSELKKASGRKKKVDKLFEVVFCENGHLCYKNDGLNCLIKKNALRQIEKVKKYVDREIKQKSARFCFSYPSSELVGEITVVIQEKEKNRSFKHRLDAFISKNSLDRLVVDELTHNRLSVSVKNINKNSAIEAYGLDLSDCYYFCDEKNDFKLAKTVVNKGGKIVCPANAIEELKNIAYYVSDKPHSYGVLDFLSSLFSNSLN